MLFRKIYDIICLVGEVSFRNEGNQFAIRLKYRDWETESWLPVSDHFKEQKIVDCISFMEEQYLKK